MWRGTGCADCTDFARAIGRDGQSAHRPVPLAGNLRGRTVASPGPAKTSGAGGGLIGDGSAGRGGAPGGERDSANGRRRRSPEDDAGRRRGIGRHQSVITGAVRGRPVGPALSAIFTLPAIGSATHRPPPRKPAAQSFRRTTAAKLGRIDANGKNLSGRGSAAVHRRGFTGRYPPSVIILFKSGAADRLRGFYQSTPGARGSGRPSGAGKTFAIGAGDRFRRGI